MILDPCQSVTNIFEYSNILVTNLYLDIRSCQICYTNIFGHSLKNSVKLLIRIYSDIYLCQNVHECHTLIWVLCGSLPGSQFELLEIRTGYWFNPPGIDKSSISG